MAEPTTTTTGIVWALAAGTLGAFFASIGVTWAAVFWALCGVILAGPLAGAVGRWRAMAMFPASVMLAAKVGGLARIHYFAANPDMAGGLAAASGVVLHPTISVPVRRRPGLIARKLGLTTSPNEGDTK